MNTNLDDFPKAAGTLIKYVGCQYAAQYNDSSISDQKSIKRRNNGVRASGGAAASADGEVIQRWWAEAKKQMRGLSEEDKEDMKCFWRAELRAFDDGAY